MHGVVFTVCCCCCLCLVVVVYAGVEDLPGKVRQFNATEVTSQSIHIQWLPAWETQPKPGITQSFQLDIRSRDQMFYTVLEADIPNPNAAGKNEFIKYTVDEIEDGPVLSNTMYEMRVRVFTQAGFGSYVYIHAKTKETPVVQIVNDSLSYSYDSTYLVFQWTIIQGEPDWIDLVYRETDAPKEAEWSTMASSLNATLDYKYKALTNVQLDWVAYEFQIVAYEGTYKTQRSQDHPYIVESKQKTSDTAKQDQGSVDIAIVIPVMNVALVIGVVVIGVLATRRRSSRKPAVKQDEDEADLVSTFSNNSEPDKQNASKPDDRNADAKSAKSFKSAKSAATRR